MLGVDASAETPSPGQRPEAGVWVVLQAPAGGNAQARFELRLESQDPASGRWLPLAEGRLALDARDAERWRFLQTQAIGPGAGHTIPVTARRMRLVVSKSGSAAARLDFVQAAPRGRVDGLPPRLALAAYAGWYRSPLSSESTGLGNNPKERWQNWAWSTPPFCDPQDTSLFHVPDCQASSTCFRANGRRHGASSVLAGLDALPLAGTYDSRDPDLVAYHARVAEAIGFDVLVVDWYGRLLAEQTVLPGEAPVGLASLSALLDAAEQETVDLKVAVMYEPKVHMSNWVQGEASFAAKKAGIVDDLIWLIETHGARRALLRRRGMPVVFVFGQNACTSGGACLDDDDWAELSAQVEAATGESLVLVATDPPAAFDTPFQGYVRWGLVAPSILRYASWPDFVARREKVPAATVHDVLQHARLIDDLAATWAGRAPGRFGVSTVWPGFDDTGVAGWGSQNGTGGQGGALCVRVVNDPGGAFLSTTFAAALEADLGWLHLCTFNDWNEGTAIEPAWNGTYVADVAAARASSSDTLDAAFGRAVETQAGLAVFKGPDGLGLEAAEVEAVAREYLRAVLRGEATAYD
jgi:hypothetical protein